MNHKGSYRTRQSEEIRAFLESAQGHHITAGDVCEYFRKKETAVGTATVYRQLEKLVEDGVAAKYSIDPSTPACFEYLGPHLSEENCYHCKCQVCGRLIHMQCEELVDLRQHLLNHHGFAIDPRRTVFYGICETCAEVSLCEN